jgi:hypothetical protein
VPPAYHVTEVANPEDERPRGASRRLVAVVSVISFVVGGFVFPIATGIILDLYREGRAAPNRTEVSFFDPAVPGSEPLKITETDHGSCNGFSNVNAASAALRCFGRYIYDPCFSGATGGFVCLGSPWDEDAVLFRGHVREWPSNRFGSPRSPARATPRRTAPWALQLANGRRCAFVSGATYAIAGERLNYQCSTGRDPFGSNQDGFMEWVVGVPDRSVQPWIVKFMIGRSTEEVLVVRAWY